MHRGNGDCDLLVVGTGAAGLVAAVTAAEAGMSVVVIEKAKLWGGTSAMSGGGMFIPVNDYLAAKGEPDTYDAAMKYLDAAVQQDGVWTSHARRAAYVKSANKMVRFLQSQGMKLQQDLLPDYLQKLPGARIGRLIEAARFDGKKLGEWEKTRRPGTYPMAVETWESPVLGKGMTSLKSIYAMIRLPIRYYLRRAMGEHPVTCGESLVSQLLYIALRSGVKVHLNTPLRKVIMDEGRVIGAEIEFEGKIQTIHTRAGVFLAAGGFAHAEWRKQYQGMDGTYSSASPDDTGEVIALAEELGAAKALMDQAWWGTAQPLPPGNPVCFTIPDRSLPGSIMINKDGRRFMNESQNYVDAGHDMIRDGIDSPRWIVFDHKFRKNYMMGNGYMMPGKTPQAMYDLGFLFKADTLEGLAEKIGVDPAAMKHTVERFNGFAKTGVDEDFGRGDNAYDNYYGNELVARNPNLGPLEKPPFYAWRTYIGDLGTKGGYVTDEYARVLDHDDRPIEGLYAAGNVTASVMGNRYPGPGSTLGPAATFGYLGAQHAATSLRRNEPV